jgi:pilus assembly protein Flp/PilA
MTKEVSQMVQRIKDLLVDEEGAALVEYALLLGLVAIIAILGLTPLGTKVKDMFVGVDKKLVVPP